MSIEQTLAQFEISLVNISDRPATVAVPSRIWWSLTKIALGGLLLTYLVGCFQDFERVRDLRVEPAPASKIIITKREAWERVHPRRARPRAWAAAVQSRQREDPLPVGDPSDDARVAMMDLF
jgi:hypothetical protein